MPKIRRSPVVEDGPFDGLGRHWWRIALLVLALVAAVLSGSVFYGVVAAIPLVLWCGGLARHPRVGIPVGLVLLALMVWFTVPRGLGWSGRRVPSADEVLWLHPVVASVVCRLGMGRRPPGEGMWLVAVVLSGFCLTGAVLVGRYETPPGDENVVPGPAELRIDDHGPVCGSHSCAREVYAIGDHPRAAFRAHLADEGFSPAPPSFRDERLCRATGLVVAYEICAELRDINADTVQITWYRN